MESPTIWQGLAGGRFQPFYFVGLSGGEFNDKRDRLLSSSGQAGHLLRENVLLCMSCCNRSTGSHRSGTAVPASKNVVELSPRERQVMLLLIAGDSRKQVAAKLKLSQHTVADYLKEIYVSSVSTAEPSC